MLRLGTGSLFDLPDGLLDAFDVSDFVDAQLFEIATFQRQQFRAADVVTDEIVAIVFQLQRFQPGGHFVVAPLLDVELVAFVAGAVPFGGDGSHPRIRSAEFQPE